ncbi:globin domain-containing protein [Gemmatimonas sp.]|uniref:globin domain-containing protein n=1 Tax=Gemmatimonas sp. TaxID=1962908 RepID=UPI003564419C
MTKDSERSIRDSWMRLFPLRLIAAQRFYERLFETDASAKLLFDGTQMHVQRVKFVQTIDLLVQMLDFPSNIVDELQSLARLHGGYGVTIAQYETVGAALLWALEQTLDDDWTPEVHRAWSELYGFISGVMIREVSSLEST